jgi:phosphatidylserine/phosphatidylglycerophosphate/cardiolipin synthase-like enzyme
MSDPSLISLSPAVRQAFAPILEAFARARQDLADVKDVAAVRPGYEYPAGAPPQPAVIVAVTPGERPVAEADLEKKYGVPVVVLDATVEEQMARLAAAEPVSFATPGGAVASAFENLISGEPIVTFGPPKSGSYEPLDPANLPLVEESMELTICVSPEAGWSELEDFLGKTQKSLTVAMYQFTAPHIFDAVSAAVSPKGRQFELVLHPVPEKPASSGVKADDLDENSGVLEPLENALQGRFEMAWATLVSNAHPEGLWASAYHIKVAVRDGQAVWVSSGNWQSSNQPNVHPFKPGADLPSGFQRKYNRDYHAIFKNERIASIFEQYIKRDHDLSAAQAGAPSEFALPDLFVQDVEVPEPFAAPPRFFKPLRLDRTVSVQPLLTPDNYAENALALIRSARTSVWFQNQYINFRGTDEDFTEFKLLITALKDQIDQGREVRIICRDMMKQESLDILVALGFPAEVFRFQPACHNKCIIVDKSVVMFGSHNWSNEGVKTNRDASLIFKDKEIAEYLAEVYDYDWNRLATAHPTKARPRVARRGEATPQGFARVAHSEVLDD